LGELRHADNNYSRIHRRVEGMSTDALCATALLAVFPIVSQAAATEEAAPVRPQEVSDRVSSRDAAATPIEARAVPDNLRAARKADASPLGDIKILPSF
jgi:hypothetical protein